MISTTIEESKRLIAAGISPDTADMCWRNYALTYDFGHAMEVRTVEPILYAFNAKSKDDIPAWSLGALWDLCKEKGYCLEFNTKEDTSEGMIEHMVNILADPIIGIMDKVANNEI